MTNNEPPTQPSPEKPRFILRNAAYALEPQPALEWIVDRLITPGSVTVFYGEPGSKKTYSMLSMAVCVAAGKDWLQFKTRPGNVLIVDEESGEKRLRMRLGAALLGELVGPETPVNFVSLAGFKMDDKNDPVLLEALIAETGAKLVIIDALADIMDGDENLKKDVQPVFNALRKIAERTCAAIIIIHHSNKQGGYRGSSTIKGSIDSMIKIESEDGSKWINFKGEKIRDGEPISWAAVATWTEEQFYLSQAEPRKVMRTRPDSENFVIEFIKQHGATDIETLEENADICSPKAARAAAYRLAKEKTIQRVNEGGKGIKAKYDLTEKM